MILIVDDDPSVTTSLGLLFKQNGLASMSASGPDEALQLLDRHPFRLVLQDMNFSRSTTGEEGLELLSRTRAQHPELPVILITAWGSIALAVEGVKAGAADFITKPWTNAGLLKSVETVLSLAAARIAESARRERDRDALDAAHDFGGLVGRDPAFLRILELIARLAPTDASVIITGESGTGKELVAEAIHKNSRRSDGPFVKVNLGGISSTLFESEMFGHVKGAFTDAASARKGRFEVAGGGTIFLDEIGELEQASQVKLLRVLQDRTYEVLGSSTTRTVDVRVVSATNCNLTERVAEGAFREDLLYRLNLISIRLPALRERADDIPLLAAHFANAAQGIYRTKPFAISARAMDWLRAQAWPGNVRQLKQTIERAMLVLEGNRLEPRDLEALAELETGERKSDALPNPGAMTLDQIERGMIEKCLRHYEGNVTHVAEALGLSRAALYRRLEKYHLTPR